MNAAAPEMADLIRSLEARIDELNLEAARQTHVIRRLVNRESRCEHADDGRHQCKHCDAYYPTAVDGEVKP